MAKERMITRTVTLTTVKVLCVEVGTQATSTEVFHVTGCFDDATTLLAQLQKQYGSENFLLVAILDREETEKLYAMPESVFVSMATEIPPRAKAE